MQISISYCWFNELPILGNPLFSGQSADFQELNQSGGKWKADGFPGNADVQILEFTVTAAPPVEIQNDVSVTDECVDRIGKICQTPQQEAVLTASQLGGRHAVPKRLRQSTALTSVIYYFE